MRTRRILALGVAVTLATAGLPLVAAGQQGVTINGTAKDEARKPFSEYTARARNVADGQIAGMAPLDTSANFSLTGLPPANYVVELISRDGKIVCTAGPFNLGQQLVKENVNIDCNRVPSNWWLLGAAALAGITAGVVAGGTASASQ